MALSPPVHTATVAVSRALTTVCTLLPPVAQRERERVTGSTLYGAEPSDSIADFKPSGLAVAWTT